MTKSVCFTYCEKHRRCIRV